MRIKSSLQDLDSAINKEIESQYDKIKIVADNINAIITASTNSELSSRYLGTFTENPITQTNGNALVHGNFYFNNSVENLGTYYYDSTLVLWKAVSGSTAGVYDDTAILAAVLLNTDKVSNIDHPLVEKSVPSNAVFIDTTYEVEDGGLTEKNFTLANKNKLADIANNANNYVLPFANNSSQWNIANGWGDHSLAGYVTLFYDSSPVDGQILTFDTTNGWQAQNAPSGGAVSWGDLNGTLSDQTDLQVVLDNKINSSDLVSDTHVKALNQSVVTGSSPNFTIANVTLDNTNLKFGINPSLQNFAEQVDKALLRARGTGVSTSYTATIEVGGSTFSIPTLEGEITSDEGYFSVYYEGATNVTVLDLSSSSTWVYIDKTNALQQQTTAPTRQDRTRKVFLIRIGVNTTSSEIINFEYDNNPIGHYANSMRDLYEFLLVQGVPFKKDQVVTGRSDNLGFNVSSGQLLEFGGTGDINNPNIKSFNAVSNANYNWMSRTAVVSSESNLLKYWDNNGVLTALGSTTCVAHRLFRFSSGNFAMQPGQGNYANIILCKAGAKLEEYDLNPVLKNATFFGWWLIEETATSTSATVKAEFVEYTLGVQGGSSSGLSGALLRGNNFSDLLDATLARSNLGINTTENQNDSLDKRFVTDSDKNKLVTMPSTLVVSSFPESPIAGTLYIKVVS